MHEGDVTAAVIRTKNAAIQFLENLVFNIRWVLPLFYLGLIVVLGVYGYTYVRELMHLVYEIPTSTEAMKIVVLDMVDVVMIANLVKMIITGSYNSFISKDHGYPSERISSGMLKIKIMTSIVIVASIGLLRNFVTESVEWEIVYRQLAIYGAFLLGAVALGFLEYMHIKGEVAEHGLHHKGPSHD